MPWYSIRTPSAKQISCLTISLLNDAIVKAGGPRNLLTAIAQPTIESAQALMRHPKINLLVVTRRTGSRAGSQ